MSYLDDLEFTHAGALRHTGVFLLIGHINYEGLGGEEHCSDRSSVLDSAALYLSRVDDTGFSHINIFKGHGVEADAFFLLFDTLNHYFTRQASVVSDLTDRSFEGLNDDFKTSALIAMELFFFFFKLLGDIEESCTAAWYVAFFNGCAGGVKSIFKAQFAIFEFGFGSSADFDYSNTASQWFTFLSMQRM
jgi:hypothetical protein